MENSRKKYIVMLAVPAVLGGIVGGIFSLVRHPQSIEQMIQPLRPSLILYVLFSLYWSIAARNSAPVKSSEHWASTVFHQALLGVSMLLLILRVPGLTGRWLPVSPIFLPLGLAVQASATMLAVWARRHLGSNWSAEISAKVDHQLIRSGPYRLLRHPIYTAVFGIHIGIAIASGEWHALAGIVVLSLAYWRKIHLEEQNLHAVFGTDYEAYRRQSWALVPWV